MGGGGGPRGFGTPETMSPLRIIKPKVMQNDKGPYKGREGGGGVIKLGKWPTTFMDRPLGKLPFFEPPLTTMSLRKI